MVATATTAAGSTRAPVSAVGVGTVETAITRAGLKARTVEVNSDKSPGTVTAQRGIESLSAKLAKRGLDDILEGYRDPLTGRLNLDSRGRAIEAVRKAYVSHLDTLNPDYAAARAAWAGPSQALDAMSLGARIVTEDNREITRLLSGMSANEREFVQVGVVDAVRKALRSAPDGAEIRNRSAPGLSMSAATARSQGSPPARPPVRNCRQRTG